MSQSSLEIQESNSSRVSLEFRNVLVDIYMPKPFVLEPIRRGEYWVHISESGSNKIYRIYPTFMQDKNSISLDAYLDNSDERVHLGEVNLEPFGHDIEKKVKAEARGFYTAAEEFGRQKAAELGAGFENLVKDDLSGLSI